jgi:hypothetical protein
MSYWKCKEAKISDDGLSITLGFKDEHSCSTMNMTLPAEEWKDILIYRAAYNEPDRRMYEAQKKLFDYWRDRIELDREESKK